MIEVAGYMLCNYPTGWVGYEAGLLAASCPFPTSMGLRFRFAMPVLN